jgi:hypothetical protein
MRGKKRFNSTLGKLIEAITDEVTPLPANTATINVLVSYILQDLFIKRRVRLRKSSALMMS